jgi:hypothetical protein
LIAVDSAANVGADFVTAREFVIFGFTGPAAGQD